MRGKIPVIVATILVTSIAALLAWWIIEGIWLSARVNSFKPIGQTEVPGVYLANHGGSSDQLTVLAGHSYLLEYKDAARTPTRLRGKWSFLSDENGEPELSLFDVSPGRAAGNSSPPSNSWLERHSGRFDVPLRRAPTGRIYLELHPDRSDYYEKQY